MDNHHPISSEASQASPTSVDPLRSIRVDSSLTACTSSTSTSGSHSEATSATHGSIELHGSVPEGARPLRSKKQRPCDRCRHRKSRCAISVIGEPCTECSQTGNSCTFLLPPPARPKKESLPSILDPPPPPLLIPSPTTSAGLSSSEAQWRSTPPAMSYERPPKRHRPNSPPEPQASNQPAPFSLDRDLPSDVDPSAVTATLTDDLLTHNGVGPPSKMVSNSSHSTFITFSRKPARPSSVEVEAAALRRIRSFFAFVARGRVETEFIDRYYSRIHPSFPVLAPSTPFESLPPGLQALILVESLATFPGFRDAGLEARRMVREFRLSEQMLETQAKLSSISAALLELNMHLDPRGDFLLLSKTIAHAQLLGLHIDSQGWAIPQWEKNLRLHLWWALRIQDAWTSFLNSRPSHLQPGNTSVPLPSFVTEPARLDSVAFGLACRLGVVVARLQQEVSTLERYGNPQRIDSCDSIESDLNQMKEGLKDYFEIAPLDRRSSGLDAVLFLVLALRCMVRRIGIEIRIGIGSAFTPDLPTLSIFSELVSFVETLSLVTNEIDQDFPGYSSHVFSSVLSSLVRLSLAHATTFSSTVSAISGPTATTPIALLSCLVRSLLRLRSARGFDTVDTALGRASDVVNRLRLAGTDEFAPVIAALGGDDTAPESSVLSSLDSDLLDTLASLAAAPPLAPAGDSTARGVDGGDNWQTASATEFGGTQDDWLSVLDERPLWENGIDWSLFAT